MKKRNFGIFLVALIIVMPLFVLPNAYATTISKEQIDAFRTAKTVRIVVNQSYGEAEGVSLPFEDTAKKFLEYAGLRVVSATENYDLMLKIEAEGQALGANYQYAGWLYTGASLSGSISLEAQGVPAYRKSFSGRVSPPTVTGFRSKSPADAPFRVVSISGGVTRSTFHEHGSFVSKIAEIVGEVYSADSLISALKDENSDVRGGAAEALGDIKDPQAVEPLIAALKDEDWTVQDSVAEALEIIAGQDFGRNQTKWQDWWEQNKESFHKAR